MFKFYFITNGIHRTKTIKANGLKQAKEKFLDSFGFNVFVYDIREIENSK